MAAIALKRRQEIEKIADRARAHSNADYLDTNLDQIIESLGTVKVLEMDLDDRISGSISKEDGNFKIILNAKHPLGRKRFTVAHELGHFFLHLNEKQKEFIDVLEMYRHMMKYTKEQEEQESEANYFAACLLMPKDKVLKAWTAIKEVQLMSEIFGVSVEAMNYRLKNLSLLTNG